MRKLLAILAVGVMLVGCTSTTDVLEEFSTAGVRPRLENGAPERLGAVINEAAFNSKAIQTTTAPYTGFVGPVRVSYNGDRNEISRDLNALGPLVGNRFNPNETVTVDFQKASLNYILDQLLGGALGINYIVRDGLPQGIDFRTEEPIPKSRILQVVRDLLSRNGLMMRLSNGVYHIGTEGEIAAIAANTAVGRSGEEITRVVRLERGNAQQVIDLASRLLPPNVSIMVTGASDSVVIRANPSDIDSVQQMLVMLSRMAVGSDSMAIIPLSRSAPEAVAAQLTQFYAPSLREPGASVMIIPLQNQQAILVRAADAATMDSVRQLAGQLDRSVTDVTDLRVIALKHVRAAELAPQLSSIFGSMTIQPAAAPIDTVRQARESTGVRSRLQAPRMTPPSDNEDGTGLAVPPPQLPARASSGGEQEASPQPAALTAPPQGGETRIVADPRSNALLVHSTYSVYKRMREVVETLDIPQAQVVIEATVVEVVLNDRLESGVQFFLQSNGIVVGSGVPSGNQSPDAGGVLGVSTNIGNVTVDAVVRALRAVTALKVVSSPYLTVVDRETARLVIGDQIPFASTTQTSSSGGGVTVTRNIEILDTGVVLEITPTINTNNSVNLNIMQSVSSPVSNTSEDGLTPTIATRDLASHILAQSGRTVLLGGLIQDRLERGQDGVPGAADLPVLGRLFRQERATARRTELLVLITPRVVRSSSEIEAITRLLQGAGGALAVSGDLKAR